MYVPSSSAQRCSFVESSSRAPLLARRATSLEPRPASRLEANVRAGLHHPHRMPCGADCCVDKSYRGCPKSVVCVGLLADRILGLVRLPVASPHVRFPLQLFRGSPTRMSLQISAFAILDLLAVGGTRVAGDGTATLGVRFKARGVLYLYDSNHYSPRLVVVSPRPRPSSYHVGKLSLAVQSSRVGEAMSNSERDRRASIEDSGISTPHQIRNAAS